MADASVDGFLDELAHQRRASPHTLAAYGRDLARLTALAGERARSDMLRRIGFGQNDQRGREDGVLFVVASLNIAYHRAAVLDATGVTRRP